MQTVDQQGGIPTEARAWQAVTGTARRRPRNLKGNHMFVVVNPAQRNSCPAVTPDAPATEVASMMAAMQIERLWVVDPHGNPLGMVTMAGLARASDPAGDPIFAGRARRRWWELPPAATAGDLMTPIPAAEQSSVCFDTTAFISPDAA